MKIDIKVVPEITGKTITIDTFLGDMTERIHRKVLDTEEKAIRESLIALGWTPPPDSRVESRRPSVGHFKRGDRVEFEGRFGSVWDFSMPDAKVAVIWDGGQPGVVFYHDSRTIRKTGYSVLPESLLSHFQPRKGPQ